MSSIETISEDLYALFSETSLIEVSLTKDIIQNNQLDLNISGELWMNNFVSDDDQHRFLAKNATGNVLIGGLGLGGDVLLLKDLPNVDSIHVVENNQNVIDLVWDLVSESDPHLDIYNDTLDNFMDTTNLKFDFIWIDIHREPYYLLGEEVIFYTNKAQSILNPNGEVAFWKDPESQGE